MSLLKRGESTQTTDSIPGKGRDCLDMKMQCTVRFNFVVDGLNIRGSYDPAMGNASALWIGGENVLHDDGEGNISACIYKFISGAEIISGTLKSQFSGRILSVSVVENCGNVFPPEGLSVVAVGEFSGTQGSIMGGVSCHCGWKIVAVSAVSGRFGTFEIHGGDPLARYNHAKTTHRARFYSNIEMSWGNEAQWTKLAYQLAAELGHTLAGSGVVRPDNPEFCSPAYWADNCEAWLEEKGRLARLAKVKRLTKNVPPNAWDVRFQDRNGKLRWDYVMA